MSIVRSAITIGALALPPADALNHPSSVGRWEGPLNAVPGDPSRKTIGRAIASSRVTLPVNLPMLNALARIRARVRQFGLTKPTRDYVREARSGGMYGDAVETSDN